MKPTNRRKAVGRRNAFRSRQRLDLSSLLYQIIHSRLFQAVLIAALAGTGIHVSRVELEEFSHQLPQYRWVSPVLSE